MKNYKKYPIIWPKFKCYDCGFENNCGTTWDEEDHYPECFYCRARNDFSEWPKMSPPKIWEEEYSKWQKNKANELESLPVKTYTVTLSYQMH
jgi:DNA-directed RNA polymerase subunit RPC12/RpoP